MISAFYSAVSGAGAYQDGLNVGADNLANVGTAGFQSRRAEFSDLMYTRIPAPGQDAQAGSGTRLSGVSRSLAPGTLEETGAVLDAAIGGDGYFCVRDASGALYYTRAGNFGLEPSENGNLLVTRNGGYVLDQDMNPIQVGSLRDLKLTGPSGDTADHNTVRLAVVSFENPGALASEGGGLLSANALSGQGALLYGADVLQGTLEKSNVDVTGQMQGLIRSQRGFQLAARMIETADELEQTANSLR